MLTTKRRKAPPGIGISELTNIIVKCDRTGCTAEEHSEGMEFDGFMEDLRDEGWVSRKIGEDWWHWCKFHTGKRGRRYAD